MPHVVTLALDRTGQALTNLITDEEHTLANTTKRLVIPRYGSFFKDSLVVKDSAGTTIDPSKYEVDTLYQDASLYGLPIFNYILITDATISKNIKITYQALGGLYSTHNPNLLQWFNEHQRTGQTEDWANIEDKPKRYRPSEHKQHIKDLYGAEYLQKPLELIAKGILQSEPKSLIELAKKLDTSLDALKAGMASTIDSRVEQRFTAEISSGSPSSVGLSNLGNYPTMQDSTASQMADRSFKAQDVNSQEYLTLRSLKVFAEKMQSKWVSQARTAIAKPSMDYKDPTKANLLSMRSGQSFLLHSKRYASENSNDYTDGIYPKDIEYDEDFAIIKISSSDTHYGGVWLGFGLSSAKAYILTIPSDACHIPLSWEKILTTGELDGLAKLTDDHAANTNNPHRTDKTKIGLSRVENLPVVTTEDIIAGKGVRKYVTLDTLIYHAQKELMNIKPPKMVDGKPDPNYKPMDQDTIVFSTCKKCLNEPETHSKGMLVKTWCEGTDKFARYTDGKGGYEDKVLQLDSDDCKFVDVPKEGTVIATYCKNTTKVARIADGKGESFIVPVEINSKECGYVAPAPAGTKIAEYCSGRNEMIRYSDGAGGAYEVVHAIDSARCGGWPRGTVNPPANYQPGGSGDSTQRLTLSITPSVWQTGTIINEYVTLSGFTPNSTVQLTAGFKSQYYNNGNDYINPEVLANVQIDSAGAGSYTRTYPYNDQLYKIMQVPPGVTEIYTTGFYRAAGIESNRVTCTLKFPDNVAPAPTPTPTPTPQPQPPQPQYTKTITFQEEGVAATTVYVRYEAGQMHIVRADDMSVLAVRSLGGNYSYTYYDMQMRPMGINSFPTVFYSNGNYSVSSGVNMTESQFNNLNKILRRYIDMSDSGNMRP